MKYVKYLMLIGLMFVFTGCTTKIDFQESLIQSDLNQHLKKVDTEKITIQKHNAIFVEKAPDSLRGVITKTNVDMSNLNEKILESMLNQYFKNVKISNTQENININSKLIDYNYKFGAISDSIDLSLKVNIVVIKENKEILNKTYEYDSSLVIIVALRASLLSYIEEFFNKSLFMLYETQFKPDLLKALEENQ